MSNGINTGVLTNAQPLTTEQIVSIENNVLQNDGAFVYLDGSESLSFALPSNPEPIKQLAWNYAYELTTENDQLTKKVYTKTGLDSYKLSTTLQKQSYNDPWSGVEVTTTELEGSGAEYHETAPSVLSFRSTAPLDELQEVQINGQTVDPSNYTLEEGSTIVKLSVDYLKTLDASDYEIAVVSTDQKAVGTFSVIKNEINEFGFYYNQVYVDADKAHGFMFIGRDPEADAALPDYIHGRYLIYYSHTDKKLTPCGFYHVEDDTIFSIGLDQDLSNKQPVFNIVNEQLLTEVGIVPEFAQLTYNPGMVYVDSHFLYSRYTSDSYEAQSIRESANIYGAIKDNICGVPVTNIGAKCFDGGTFTDFVLPNSITTIGDGAFANCANLTHITIPDSVTHIGKNAFNNCTELSSVVLGNGVTKIDLDTFNKCKSLTEINIPDSVIYIGDRAFKDCENLVSATLGNNVTEIGYQAFSNCNELSSIVIPDSVTYLGDAAFETCTSLASVTIGNGVTSIGGAVFSDCPSLTSITIPDSVTSIGKYAFAYGVNLTSIVIPDSVTSIDTEAFLLSEGLCSVTIGNNVKNIGYYAFDGCEKLIEVVNNSELTITAGSDDYGSIAYYAKNVHSGESNLVNVDDYIFFTHNDTNYLLGYVGSDAELTLPANYNGQRYEIYTGAFTAWDAHILITSLTIPTGITAIGDRAFYWLSSYVNIVFNGTIAQWNDISKGNDLFNGYPIPNIQCTDGLGSI